MNVCKKMIVFYQIFKNINIKNNPKKIMFKIRIS